MSLYILWYRKGFGFIQFKVFTFQVCFFKQDFIDAMGKVEKPSLYIGIAVCV